MLVKDNPVLMKMINESLDMISEIKFMLSTKNLSHNEIYKMQKEQKLKGDTTLC